MRASRTEIRYRLIAYIRFVKKSINGYTKEAPSHPCPELFEYNNLYI